MKDTESEVKKDVGHGVEENTEDRMELRKRWQSWIEEDWYMEVVWFRLFGRTKEEMGSHQLANRICRKAA